MEQNVIKKSMWNAAGTAGLALGAVSSFYLFAGQFIAGNLESASLWQQVIAIALWIIKFAGCICLMYFFMKKFADENAGADVKTVYKMGTATAFLSALMFSAIYLANMLYISADFYNQIYQMILQQVEPTLDSNSMSALGKIIDRLPQITFFYNLTYCFVYGTVLASILSRSIFSKRAASENIPDEQ